MELRDLSRTDRVLLAGCILRMIAADGIIDDAEIATVDKIREELPFADLDDRLDEYRRTVPDRASFDEAALRIEGAEKRDYILGLMYELALIEGRSESAERLFLDELKRLWEKN